MDTRKIAETEIEHVPGAEKSARIDAWWWLLILVAGTTVILVLSMPDPYGRILSFVADGIGVTVLVTALSFVLVLLVGMIGGLGRLSSNRVIYFIASLYVEIVRGIPLLVQLIWWYFALPVEIGRASCRERV